MSILLPYICLAVVAGATVCFGAGFSGWAFVVFFVLLSAGFYLLFLLLSLSFMMSMSLLIDKDKPVDKIKPLFAGITKYYMGMGCALSRVRVRLIGEEKLPAGRWLLVCNHRSGYDIVTTTWALRKWDLGFVMKPSIMKVPAIGRYAHSIGSLTIDREDDRAALKTILRAAELLKTDVTSLCIYPEGTRNRGDGLLPFRNGAFKIAQKAKVPIVVMVAEGTDRIIKNMPFRPTDVNLRILEVIPPERLAGMKTTEIGEEAHRIMAEALEKAS